MKVIIMEEPDNHIATINSKGKIVWGQKNVIGKLYSIYNAL
jgi:hypothetical protein